MKKTHMTYEQMIEKLHKDTKGGKLTLEYTDAAGDTYTKTYPMNWPEGLRKQITLDLGVLKNALDKIAPLSKSLHTTRADNAAILDEETLAVWDTYIRPFDDHDFDTEALKEMDDKLFLGEPLTDEERKLGARFEAWREDQAASRFPDHTNSPLSLVIAANRYVKALELKAAEIIVNNELFDLVKAFVLFFHAPHHVSCFSCGLVHQAAECPHCGWTQRCLVSDQDFDDLLAHQHNFFGLQ